MIKVTIRLQLATVTTLCVGLLAASPAWAQLGTTDIIAISGDAAPDGNGAILSFATNPALNDASQVAYIVRFYSGTAGGFTDDSSINLFSGGVHQILSREGDAAPDGNGVQSAFFSTALEGLGSGGAVLFSNFITGTAGILNDDFGVFQSTASGVTQIAREFSVAPVAPGQWDNFNSALSVGGSNVYGFAGDMINTPLGSADDNFVARAIGGSASIVTREGDAIPVGTGTFSSFNSPYTNASGQMAFQANLAGTTGGATDNSGVFRVNADGSETQLARAGAAVPGGNGTFNTLGARTPINSFGRAAFWSTLANTAGGFADNSGIFTSSTGFVAQIAREGQIAPDGNGTFFSFDQFSMTINDSNRVAFFGTLSGTANGLNDDTGIFVGSGGALTQVVREDQPAPDGNGEFSTFDNFSYSMNNLGIVAVEAFLKNTSGGTADDSLLVLADGIDTVTVARKGDAVAGSTINSLNIASGTSTQSSSLNEKGQLAFWASLANGQEVISVFTPDVHWRNAGSGSWSSSNNWTLGLAPEGLYDVSIDPAVGLNVTGPNNNTTVKSLTIGSTASGIASLSLSNGGDLSSTNAVTVNTRGALTVGAGRVLIAPSLSNSGGVRGSGQIDASLSNATTGQVLVGNADQLTFSAASNTNNGLIEVVGGEVRFTQDLTNAASTGLITGRDATMRFTGGLTNNGAVAVSFGTSDIHGPIFNTATGSVVVSGNANVTFYDDIANSGVINVANGSTAVFFGALSGNGVGGTGTVFLEGDARPGFSPGVMSFGGDVNLGFFSRLTAELGGLTAGTQFDQLAVAGNVTLGGTLDVLLINAFTPGIGDSFDILNWGSLTGSFGAVNLPALDSGLQWDTSSLLIDGTLSVVSTLLAGDLNADGFVGIDDLNIVLVNWNQNVTPGDLLSGDPTGEGFVGVDDLNIVLVNWNNGTPPGAGTNIPEPGTAAVLTLVGTVLLRRRTAC
jgi:hypothetical protein